MGTKDLAEKILLFHNDVFADVANVCLFDEEQVILPEELEEQAPRSFYKVDGKLYEIERDVVKRWRHENVNLACIGFENQTKSDRNMALRVMEYDGAEYRSQLQKNQNEPYPVITMVLYFGYGKPWSGPLSLRERLKFYKKISPHVKDYNFDLFQIAYLSHEQVKLFKSDFRVVADFFVQMRETGSYDGNPQQLKHVQETLQLLSVMAHDKTFAQVAQEIAKNPQGAPDNMDGILAKIKKNAKAEGKAEGIADITRLMSKLFALNRVEDAKQASVDPVYLAKLMKEFAIN